jgi:uncharacterized spore protein YtfJ
MNVDEMLKGARDALTVQRVYGEPIERDGVLIIPAANVRGGGGGGSDAESNGGGGFGLTARPAGTYIVADGQVTWEPAIDVNRIVLGAQIAAVTIALVIGSVLRARYRS